MLGVEGRKVQSIFCRTANLEVLYQNIGLGDHLFQPRQIVCVFRSIVIDVLPRFALWK